MPFPCLWHSLVEEVLPIRHPTHQTNLYIREVLPDSSPNLIWLWQDGLAAEDASQWVQLPEFSLGGLLTHKKQYYSSIHVKGVIIKLKPWALGLLKDHAAEEITDQAIRLNQKYLPLPSSMLTEASLNWQTYTAWLEPVFNQHFSSKPIDLAVVKAIQTVQQHHSAPRIKALADQAAQCTRQFERRFKAATGLTPKQFVRNVRFERARNQLALGYSLLDVTYAEGYFDQTHFTREFKAISGLTPKLFQQSNMSLFY